LNKGLEDFATLDPNLVQKQKELKIQEAMQRLREANIKKVAFAFFF